MKLEILRRANREASPFWQTFLYDPSPGETAADALIYLNGRANLRDAAGNPASPIRWECGCLQGKCGACAMVINGRPRLACDAPLSALGDRITLEPLRKFPPVADLVVDRGALYESLRSMGLWLEGAAEGEDPAFSFEASRCLQCGCCLEVCPNYAPGGTFAGMAGAVPAARLLEEAAAGERRGLAARYRAQVYEGCGKSLACRDICPAGIDMERLLSRANAAAVWGRFSRRQEKAPQKHTGRNPA